MRAKAVPMLDSDPPCGTHGPSETTRQEWIGRRMLHAVQYTAGETRAALAALVVVTRSCYSYRRRIVFLALLSPALSVPPLLAPVVMQFMIDRAYPNRDWHLFGWLCAALVALGALPVLVTVVTQYLSTYIESLLRFRLSMRLFSALGRLPQWYLETQGSGVFLERVTGDVGSVAKDVTQLTPKLVTILFTFLAAIPLMLRLDVGITLLVLAVVPINYGVTACLSRKLVELRRKSRATDERISTFTAESLQGAAVARLYGLHHRRRRLSAELLREHLCLQFATWRTRSLWGQLGGLISLLWAMGLLCGGWYLVFTDRLRLGEAVAMGMYVRVLERPFTQLAKVYHSLMTSSVAAHRVLEILAAPRAILSNRTRAGLDAPPRRLELRGLSFAYGKDRPCLTNLRLQVRSGETVALVGPSGAGKSTLIRILSGLEERYQGQFLVDGREFRDLNPHSYLRHVSLVPQNTFFFSDTIGHNLWGNHDLAPLEQMDAYARTLGLDDVIARTPQGYETPIGPGGVRFSAGQYQKLAMLRAMLKRAPILLLDEMTASMDIESERTLLRGTVSLRPRDCLTVLVTHHISITTEEWVDRVIVLVDGSVLEDGRPVELRRGRGLYDQWLRMAKGNGAVRESLEEHLLRPSCSGRP